MRRGIDDEGEVANDVETEFFIVENFPFQNIEKNVFSFVMIRGSIPIYWGHEKYKLSPKPPIVLNPEKDPEFKKSEKHFERLFECYGSDVCVLNLVKGSEKSSESMLGRAYKKFIDIFSNKLKTQHKNTKIRFKWYDFFTVYNKNEKTLMRDLQNYGKLITEEMSIFHYSVFENIVGHQNGIIRINCVDCLDRTNNAMACISSVVFAKVLRYLEINNKNLIDEQTNSVKNELLSILLEMFGVY